MLVTSIAKTLTDLQEIIQQLPNDLYSEPCVALSNSTIGEHSRHIIEMFQCLENQYENGTVNYDKRARNYQIQTDNSVATIAIQSVISSLEKPTKELYLEQCIDDEIFIIKSNYHRELLYNLEHCIHHQALIKVALLEFNITTFNKNFGVARSTIEYRNQCVQ